jgi:hypothetical protein
MELRTLRKQDVYMVCNPTFVFVRSLLQHSHSIAMLLNLLTGSSGLHFVVV